jgi:transaldolase
MTRLNDLYTNEGQSPWLDNLKRGWITNGELARWVERGVRGITSNPSIFQKAMSTGTDYDEQFTSLLAAGTSVEDSYWQLVIDDIHHALEILRAVYDSSEGIDGYVSVEVDPTLARDTLGTEVAARHLWDTIAQPNLYVKIPATAEGVPAIRQMIAEGRSINVTLIFSIERYAEVIEAYISGLEAYHHAHPTADLSRISSVASFFISRVDSELDKRLDAIGTPAALKLRGRGAVAQGKLAYELFITSFSGNRWAALAAHGARPQRPLWASTSTKNPAYPDTLYVDDLIGPDTVNTLPDATIAAFEDHGTVARTIDRDLADAHAVMHGLSSVGVDVADVGHVLEDEGVAAFVKAFDELLATLTEKSHTLR